MTNLFFSRPKTLDRLQEGPLGRYMDGFSVLLRERGYARSTARDRIRRAGGLSRWLDRRGLSVGDLGAGTMEAFFRSCKRPPRVRVGEVATFKLLLEYLGEVGVIRVERPKNNGRGLTHALETFARYLAEQRGLAAPTISRYLPSVRQFLSERYGEGEIRFAQLCASDVTRFIRRHARDLSHGSTRLMVTALRAFLRFLHLRAETTTDLAACVLPVANWQLATLPKSLERGQVERVLRRCDQNRAVGQRDYAILLLLARLGLRAGEVVTLTLEDIDWEAGSLKVRGKRAQPHQLPLPRDVGAAIVGYLRNNRPRCSTRRIFVRERAPLQGFASSVAISTIVRRALARAGINSPRKGAHLFRHTAATEMMRKGASLAEIGEILRHQRLDTTAIYAKVDVKGLRAVAQPWPGGAR